MSAIEPFYFGKDDDLFGIYHAAEGMPRRHSIVIAGPLLNEYMRAHFALRQIGMRLAKSGFDVLRFDYTGMGNSKGLLEDTLPEKWVDNIAAASQEIIDIAGTNTVSIIAVRFAANLAAPITAKRKFDKFVMWDPILDGTCWLDLLRKVRPIVMTKFSKSLLIKDREFMGHVTHISFVQAIRSRSRSPIQSQSTVAVITNEYQNRHVLDSTADRIEPISFSCGWENLSSQVLYPHEVIDTICAAIT